MANNRNQFSAPVTNTTITNPGVRVSDQPKPKNEKEKVALWHDRISVAENHKRRIKQERGWEKFIQQYKGNQP